MQYTKRNSRGFLQWIKLRLSFYHKESSFVGEFNCPGENTEKYKTFPVTIAEEVEKIFKNRKETAKAKSYRLLYIDSVIFMASLLSNLVDILAEIIHKIKYKFGHDNKKCETCRINYKDCECCLEYINVKNNLMEYICVCCKNNY